ncbi:histidine kinase [Micromonospora polyrhachis]|uniref:histidine kinase n=1 Tax=Micromonospora polyrhachis TaxID=1282883 RepID=A0A7W7WR25_9ACTN|nr:histidine kinase [Micromonospora polyrhachis]MBB4960901.1 signal transduction histidine kinase [Micromonospora polyrhachis]
MLERLGLRQGTLRRDLALAAAYLAGGLVLIGLDVYPNFRTGLEPPLIVFLGTLVTACAAVAIRRVAPRTSLAVGSVAIVVDLVLGASLGTILVYGQVLGDACVYGPPRLWRWLLRIQVALTGIASVAGVLLLRSWQGLVLGVFVMLIGVLPVVTGISIRQYRDQAAAERARAAAERARAEQTARLVELDRRQAVTAERNRMARELHDVIANHLSAVAIHATAALSVRGLDRAQLDQVLQVIRENSVQGLAEMRQMIGLLRDPGGPGGIGSGPGGATPDGTATNATAAGTSETAEEATRVRLAEVDRLVDRARVAGLAVRVETTGRARMLPVSVDLAAYRIVQESLTNALKHGSGQASLVVDYQPDLVSVTVENPLSDRTRDGALAGAGAGLIGMRERAALLHGRFDAGPRESQWRVHAELPTTEAQV